MSSERIISRRSFWKAGIAAGAFACVQCSIPVPRTRNVARGGGATQPRPRLDGKIQAGATTRADLGRLLGVFETNASDAGFFWARWEEAMLPYEWSSGSGTERDWSIRNILARFDSRGILSDYRLCSERDLIECLYSFAGRDPAPEFGEPLTCSANREALAYGTDRFHGKITFDDHGATLDGHSGSVFRPTGVIGFHVVWRGIDRIQVRYGSSSEVLHLRIHFEPQRDGVDYVEIGASPADTRRLIRALSSGNPGHR